MKIGPLVDRRPATNGGADVAVRLIDAGLGKSIVVEATAREMATQSQAANRYLASVGLSHQRTAWKRMRFTARTEHDRVNGYVVSLTDRGARSELPLDWATFVKALRAKAKRLDGMAVTERDMGAFAIADRLMGRSQELNEIVALIEDSHPGLRASRRDDIRKESKQ